MDFTKVSSCLLACLPACLLRVSSSPRSFFLVVFAFPWPVLTRPRTSSSLDVTEFDSAGRFVRSSARKVPVEKGPREY